MQKICHIDDIAEGESMGFTLGKLTLLIVKKDGLFFAYENHCPHLGIELEWQENRFLDQEGVFIQCSTHGALFEIDTGFCVSGPCAGDKLKPLTIFEQDSALYLKD